MNVREWTGLALIAIGFAMAPVGYWVGFGWALLALVPLLVGGSLFYTAHVARKLEDPVALKGGGGSDVPPGPHDLKGFHGASVLGRGADTANDDD